MAQDWEVYKLVPTDGLMMMMKKNSYREKSETKHDKISLFFNFIFNEISLYRMSLLLLYYFNLSCIIMQREI